MSQVSSANLYLGHQRERAAEGDAPQEVELSLKSALRHIFALGSSGSGKTVLSKVVVEEMTRLGVPAICLDPQGDLCSLALAAQEGDEEQLARFGLSLEQARAFHERVEVVIFTPAARRGVPLCADPFYVDPSEQRGQDRLHAISGVASMVVSLLGYDLSSDDGEGLSAAFDALLTGWLEAGRYPKRLNDFLRMIEALEGEERAQLERFISDRKLTAALRKLARLDVGARRLLFHEGLPLNIDLLLGKGARADAQEGKVRLSVIYLNSLHSAEDKDFFIAALTEQLYSWMLKHPSATPQALFYIDEVAPYIPPVRKTACKASLTLLFKQARKYGVSCLMATQNPGDVDYKAMAQFGTWAVGRLTTRQDLKKVEPTIKSLAPKRVDELMELLPSQQAGEFVLISPDNFSEPVKLSVRWLLTPHQTLDERRVELLFEERWRDRFEALEASLNASSEALTPSQYPQAQTAPQAEPPQAEPPQAEPPQAPRATSLEVDEGADEAREELNSAHNVTDESPEGDEPQALDELEASAERELSAEEARVLELLNEGVMMSANELSSALNLSSARARQFAQALEAKALASSIKEGRSYRFYSLVGEGRPELGLAAQVWALRPKLTSREVEVRLEELRQKKILGLWGEEERLLESSFVYRPLYRVCFSEQVADGMLERLFGNKSKRVEDSIYLEPQTLKVLVYTPDSPITLADKPSDQASEIPDFDGVTELEQLAPRHLNLEDEAWAQRRDEASVQASVLERFGVQVTNITPLLLPLWRARFQPEGSHQVRVLHLDAITGRPVSF